MQSNDGGVNHYQDVLVALRRVIRATDMHSKRLARTSGLTAPQVLLMQAIEDHGRVTIGQLSRAISLSQATVTTIIDRLEGRGLVLRERSASDKRKVHTILTDAGKTTLANAPVPLQEHFIDQFRNLPDAEQQEIIGVLQKVARMMDAGNIDASPFLDVGLLDRTTEKA